jgi:hypothetical protein
VIAGGTVGGAIHRESGYRGPGDLQAGKKGIEVGLHEASAKFNQSDALAGTRSVRGKTIELSDLRHGVRDGVRGVAGKKVEARLGLGPIVKSQDAFHDSSKMSGNMDGAHTAAISAAAMLILAEFHSESAAHGSGRAGKGDQPPRGVLGDNLQPLLASKGLNLRHIVRMSTVQLRKFLAGETFHFALLLRVKSGIDGQPRTEVDAHLNLFFTVGRAEIASSRGEAAVATRQGNVLGLRFHWSLLHTSSRCGLIDGALTAHHLVSQTRKMVPFSLPSGIM